MPDSLTRENSITAKMRQVQQPNQPIRNIERITTAAYEKVTKPLPSADALKHIDVSKLKLSE